MVNATNGHAVGFEGPGDQEDAFGEGAQENDTLAAESAGDEDEDCAWLEGFAVFGWVDGFAGLGIHVRFIAICTAFELFCGEI